LLRISVPHPAQGTPWENQISERKIVKLRILVTQEGAILRGSDAQKSIGTINVNPEELSAEERMLLADRLHGIDVCQLGSSEQGVTKRLDSIGRPILIEAKSAESNARSQTRCTNSLGRPCMSATEL